MDAYRLELALTAALVAAVAGGWLLRWLWERLGRRSAEARAEDRIAVLEEALAASRVRAQAAEEALALHQPPAAGEETDGSDPPPGIVNSLDTPRGAGGRA
ncbi:MAG: hypothetical protein AAF698_03105 [Pseudomonadota bacterium]